MATSPIVKTLLDLIRFKSTKVEGLTSLAEAKDRMQPEQKAIYYITGGSESMLRNSPLLEIYKKKGIEVLSLMMISTRSSFRPSPGSGT